MELLVSALFGISIGCNLGSGNYMVAMIFLILDFMYINDVKKCWS